MKKVLSMFLLLVLLCFLAACDGIIINDTLNGGETTAPTVPEETTRPAQQPPAETTGSTEVSTEERLTEAIGEAITAEALWEKLAGCYTCGSDRFVYFTYNDEGPAFLSGFWDNPAPYNRAPATVTNVANLGGERYTLTLVYPPNEENAADEQDLRPLEYTIALQTDELHKGIVYMETPESSGFEYYIFSGYSYNDAFDAVHDVRYATFAEMREFWSWLKGYWNSDDGRFVCFDQKDENSLIFMEGIWDSGSRGWADFEKAMSGYMDMPMEFVVYYPPVSNELDGDLPAEYARVFVDWMEVETHGHIFVKLGKDDDWRRYHYAGASYEEAYPND